MKHFTLILIAGALVAAPAASAKKFTPRVSKTKSEVTLSDSDKRAKKIATVLKAAKSNELLPTKQELYVYEDGEWLLDISMTLTYDADGNILTTIGTMSDFDGLMRTTYTYDAYGNCTSEINSSSTDDGKTWTDTGKSIKKYDDPIIHNLNTYKEIAMFSGEEWNTYINKFEVIRNSDGNVTNYNVIVPFNGVDDVTVKTTLTYPEGKQQPASWALKNLDYDYVTGDPIWQEGTTLGDIIWETCNGQIATTHYGDLFTGDNKIKSAVMYEDGEYFADVAAEYPNAQDMTIVFSFEDEEMSGRETVSREHTDDYGSYIEKDIAEYFYADMPDEVEMEGEIFEVKCDEHGNIISEIGKMIMGDIEDLMAQNAYDYTYGDNGEVLEMITSEIDFDTEEMVYRSKMVSSDFITAGAGINNVDYPGNVICKVEDDALKVTANGEMSVEIYSVTGATALAAAGNGALTVDLSSLSSGVYVAKISDKNDTTTLKFAR